MTEAFKKILVVDDDPLVIKLVREVLEKDGFAVVTASDGIDAMVMTKQEKPDLIVLDIMMPEINGYDVCRNLKFDPEFKHIPIIILTARNQELDPSVATMMTIDYIQKPFNRRSLSAKVKRLLKNEDATT